MNLWLSREPPAQYTMFSVTERKTSRIHIRGCNWGTAVLQLKDIWAGYLDRCHATLASRTFFLICLPDLWIIAHGYLELSILNCHTSRIIFLILKYINLRVHATCLSRSAPTYPFYFNMGIKFSVCNLNKMRQLPFEAFIQPMHQDIGSSISLEKLLEGDFFNGRTYQPLSLLPSTLEQQ